MIQTKAQRNAESPRFPQYLMSKFQITFKPILESKVDNGRKPIKPPYSLMNTYTDSPRIDLIEIPVQGQKNSVKPINKVTACYLRNMNTINEQPIKQEYKMVNLHNIITNQRQLMKTPISPNREISKFAETHHEIKNFRKQKQLFSNYIDQIDNEFNMTAGRGRPKTVMSKLNDADRKLSIQRDEQSQTIRNETTNRFSQGGSRKYPRNLTMEMTYQSNPHSTAQSSRNRNIPSLMKSPAYFDEDQFFSGNQQYRNEFYNTIVRNDIIEEAFAKQQNYIKRKIKIF